MQCRFLDGRVWPQEDEKQVKLMMAMIHHCTGGLSHLLQQMFTKSPSSFCAAIPCRLLLKMCSFLHSDALLMLSRW